ncbi:MAG: hypothetical protein QOE05_1073 [Actinomycetota bacterium]|jgi:hypothetical protein|nr:hypothetical protein [Actinomycetota bacterium]
MSTPLHDNAPSSRAHDVLRALRRTGMAHEAEAETVSRVLDEVHPSQDDLLAALSDAMSMSDSDPARPRLMALLSAMLRTGRFRRT